MAAADHNVEVGQSSRKPVRAQGRDEAEQLVAARAPEQHCRDLRAGSMVAQLQGRLQRRLVERAELA
ncbi:MAG: hypothetical protein WDN49_24030 [Acetobacteraceae bacterium]